MIEIKCPKCNATVKAYPDDKIVICDSCGIEFSVGGERQNVALAEKKKEVEPKAYLEIEADEVVLFEGQASVTGYKGSLNIKLTTKKLIVQREKGIIKKEMEPISALMLDKIKFYNDEAQIKIINNVVNIQANPSDYEIIFSTKQEARKFAGRLIDAATGTTIAIRGSNKVKKAFDLVDDTLGLDTRGVARGLIENGIKGTIIHGIGKKHKK